MLIQDSIASATIITEYYFLIYLDDLHICVCIYV